jgi:hypothetical protein
MVHWHQLRHTAQKRQYSRRHWREHSTPAHHDMRCIRATTCAGDFICLFGFVASDIKN